MPTNKSLENINDVEAVSQLTSAHQKIKSEIGKVIVGQTEIVEHLLVALLARGHCLLVGVPGLAKTLLIKTLAEVLDLKFSRIQFTPDLMPSDITGTEIIEENTSGGKSFKFIKGPVFANIVLADEINRTPPKTQAALLESMQEHNVTAAGQTYHLDEPFFVLATQNPIEQEGTYPLPEAQVDRFMLMVKVGYPSRDDERKIMDRMTGPEPLTAKQIVSPNELLEARKVIGQVYVDEKVKDYIVDVVFATREPSKHGLKDLAPLIEFGASPRASIDWSSADRASAGSSYP